MTALPSNVAGLVNANSAIGSETKRIADLPANVFFFSIFLRDIVFHDRTVCELDTDARKEEFIYQTFLPSYQYEAQARKAIAGLGLEEPEDVVAIVNLFCGDTEVVEMAERMFVRGAAGTPRASGGVSHDRSTGPRRRSQP